MTTGKGIEWWAREIADLQKQLRDAKDTEKATKAKRKEIEATLGLALVALEQEVRDKALDDSRAASETPAQAVEEST